MLKPPLPLDEAERLAELQGLHILDTPPEERFDRVTRLARVVFDVPIALLSLVDANRQWFKSRQGLTLSETERSISFCGHAILSDDVLMIPDALLDPRFADNPLVIGKPHIRFYAGKPLKGPTGRRLGTLCVFDLRPRLLNETQLAALRDLAAVVEEEINAAALKQALAKEQEREANLAKLTTIVESSHDAIISERLDGAIISWNEGAHKLYGYTAEETSGRPMSILVPPSRPDEATRLRQRVWRGQLVDNFETVRVTKSGKEVQVSLTISPIRNQRGKVVEASTITRDITRTKQIEEVLQASEERYRLLAENGSDVIARYSPEGLFLYVSQASERVLGYSPEELVGRSIYALFHPDDLPTATATHNSMLASRSAHTVVYRLQHKDGRYVWMESTSRPVMDQVGGAVTEIVVTYRDIGQRKQVEDKLQAASVEMSEHYRAAEHARSTTRAILDAIIEAVVLVSPDRHFVIVDRQFETMFGIPADRLLGHTVEESLPLVARVFREPAIFVEQMAGTAGDASQTFTALVNQTWPAQRELQMFSTPVRSSQGENLGRLYAFRDVTKEREVDRMKTEFVSLVSHELRTPLTSIKGFTDLILDGDAGDVNTEAREYLAIVKRNADRLVALIDDLLDISRIESGSIKLNLEPVSMQDVIAEVVASLRPQIEQKSQTLTVEAEPTMPTVRGERDRLVQVVTNLLSNAYKYTPAGGTIRIEAQRQGEFASISVTDTGIGIAAEDRKNLFTRFYRVDNSLTREVGGTGLGLSIVKSVVELNGGTINVVSEPGQGSTFTVTVPLAQPLVDTATPTPVPVQFPAAAAGSRFILVVEEDSSITDLIRRYLERGGYSVDTASSGEEALQRVGERLPDLITLDINLPGMDGLTVATRLAEAVETRRIPILVISVMQDKVRGAHLGLFNSLPKPINEAQLVETVQRLLGQSHDRRVLVADDDADVRMLLKVALDKAGFTVKTARDGKEALAVARRGGIGLLLLDLRMPVMDGFAVLQALRKDPSTAELPVIVMTGSERLKVGARASVLALGATDFVTKPFDLDTLIQEVRTIMQQGEEK